MRKVYALVPLLLLLPPVCGQVLNLRDYNYVYFSWTSSWWGARGFCRTYFTDLVTIRDVDENLKIKNGWIGLYREDTDSAWKWSRGDEPANFTMLENNQQFQCAFKFRNIWNSADCKENRSFTCYNERLVLVKEEKTWEDALNHCRGLEAIDPSKPAATYQNHRYDLATLLTEDDYVFAQEKAQASRNGVWMGMRYLAGQWVWVGGEAMQHKNSDSCPVNFCGFLLKDGTVNTRNCMHKKNFLCYKKATTRTFY